MKGGLSLFSACLLFMVLLNGFSGQQKRSEVQDVTDSVSIKVAEATELHETDIEDVPGYQIVESGDIDLGDEVRYEVWVVPDNIFLSKEEISMIATEVVEETKDSQDFYAIDVFFIDDKRQVHNGFTIGRISYQPINKTVESGDYHQYAYESDLGSAVSDLLPREYEKGTYPTKEELDIYFHWLTLVKEGQKEEKAILQTAKEYKRTKTETRKIIHKTGKR